MPQTNDFFTPIMRAVGMMADEAQHKRRLHESQQYEQSLHERGREEELKDWQRLQNLKTMQDIIGEPLISEQTKKQGFGSIFDIMERPEAGIQRLVPEYQPFEESPGWKQYMEGLKSKESIAAAGIQQKQAEARQKREIEAAKLKQRQSEAKAKTGVESEKIKRRKAGYKSQTPELEKLYNLRDEAIDLLKKGTVAKGTGYGTQKTGYGNRQVGEYVSEIENLIEEINQKGGIIDADLKNRINKIKSLPVYSAKKEKVTEGKEEISSGLYEILKEFGK